MTERQNVAKGGITQGCCTIRTRPAKGGNPGMMYNQDTASQGLRRLMYPVKAFEWERDSYGGVTCSYHNPTRTWYISHYIAGPDQRHFSKGALAVAANDSDGLL